MRAPRFKICRLPQKYLLCTFVVARVPQTVQCKYNLIYANMAADKTWFNKRIASTKMWTNLKAVLTSLFWHSSTYSVLVYRDFVFWNVFSHKHLNCNYYEVAASKPPEPYSTSGEKIREVEKKIVTKTVMKMVKVFYKSGRSVCSLNNRLKSEILYSEVSQIQNTNTRSQKH